MQLHWHRRDLRVADNAGLDAATSNGPIVPVFVLDEAVLDHAAAPRVAFLLEVMTALRRAYRDRGSDLVVRRGDPESVLADLATQHDADRVTWCADYSGLARERDERVRTRLDEAGCSTASVHDAVLQPPGSITTAEGEPYQVFTYYGRKWHDRVDPTPVAPPEAGDLVSADQLEAGRIPDLADLGFEPPDAALPTATVEAAAARLDAFCDGPIYDYDERRDYPAAESTSRLSPHLKFGTVGIRTVYEATDEALADATTEADRDGVRAFQDQLAWREFYAQVLRFNPETVRENYKSFAEPIAWRDDPEALAAWQRGETGYPFVDAGMRQLREEAWMHNRVRMVVASFLTKDLLVDWRHGYAWFRERLVDHDTANDVGGWQWAASTGTDAQPYFRVFNPTTQGERYDPDGEYVSTYVSELVDVPADVIHGWPDLDQAVRDEYAPGYPAPIVDHAERREAALATFEAARGD